MLGARARHERMAPARGLDQLLGARGGAEGEQPWRHLGQEAEVIIRLGRALERDADQVREPVREGDRKRPGATQNAGVAVGGLLARSALIDKRYREPAF